MSEWVRGRTFGGRVEDCDRYGLKFARRIALGVVATGALLALWAGLLIGPGTAAADEWSGSSELSNPSTRDAEQLVIDANPLGDLVAGWKQSADDDIAALFKAFDGSPGAPQEYVGDYDDPDIAIGGNSVAALAFEDGTGSTSIHAASKDSGATAFTSAIPFSGDGVGAPYNDPPSAAQPSVAVNGLGTGMLFFARDYYYPPNYTGIAEAIEGRILLNPTTNTWNAGADLNQDVYDPRGTEVSVAPDGSAFLGINHFNIGPCWGIDTAVLENDGTGSNDPDQFAYTCAGNPYAGSYPSNSRLPNNDVVMAFRNNQEDSVKFLDLPKARALTGTSNLEASEVRLDEGGGTQRTSRDVLVRTDAAGNTLVAWYDSNSGVANPKSMLARFRPSGGIFGPAEVISSGEDYSGEFDLDMDAAGNAYIVYGRTTGANEEIVASERAAGASSWTAPELLSETQGDVDHPQVAAGRNGQAFASWIANTSDDVFYAENSAPQCSDGIDNDSDGQTDHPADPGCTGPDDDSEVDPVVEPDPQCSDGIDNDSDGKTDHPADPGCTGPDDDSEIDPVVEPDPVCSDGIDNDGDGKIDFPADPGCTSATDGSEADQVVGPDGSACAKAENALKKANKQVKAKSKKVKKAKKAVKKSSGKKRKRAKNKLRKQKKKLKKAQKKKRTLKKRKKKAC